MRKLLCVLMMCIAAVACAQEKTITLDVKDMEIGDVLRMIADQSGMNIITSKNVKGLVTINLQNVPVERVLDAILKVNNCGFIKEGDIIQVYTLPELNQKEQFSQLITKVYRLEHIKAMDLRQTVMSLKSGRGRIEIEPKTNSIIVTDIEESVRAIEAAIKQMDSKLETRVYVLSYAKPADVQKNLLSILPQAEGDVLVDERTNSIVVTGAPVVLNKIDSLIASWDKQIKQVLIEARIMQITLGKNLFTGIEWQYKNPEKHSLSIGSTSLPIPTGATYVDAFSFGVLTEGDYNVTIQALAGTSDANLISSPRVMTQDNTEAKILIGSSEPYEVFHYDSDGTITGKEVKFVEVGIKLTVTPKIAADGYVTLNIRPEVSSPRLGTATSSLAIDTTEANATMTVKDGQTVVMGGLIKDEKNEYVAKIPILGDIPWIKYLFRNTYKTTSKKETVIFITPKIISPAAQENAPLHEMSLDIRNERMQVELDDLDKHPKQRIGK